MAKERCYTDNVLGEIDFFATVGVFVFFRVISVARMKVAIVITVLLATTEANLVYRGKF